MLRFRAQGLRHHPQEQVSLGLAVARHLHNLWDDVVESLAKALPVMQMRLLRHGQRRYQ